MKPAPLSEQIQFLSANAGTSTEVLVEQERIMNTVHTAQVLAAHRAATVDRENEIMRRQNARRALTTPQQGAVRWVRIFAHAPAVRPSIAARRVAVGH